MNNKKGGDIHSWKSPKVDFAEVSLEMKLNKEIDEKKHIFLGVLDLVDDIDRITASNEENSEGLKYLNVMRKKALKLLERYGVVQMHFENNKARFGWCEVIDTKRVAGNEEETIIQEVKKGYLWNDKVLRLASVIITKNEE